jgi:hypothetical protein
MISKEVKTGCDSTGSSKDACGSKMSVLAMMMMMTIMNN